ncbi:MAG: hypothetical protein ACNYPI_07660 [Arenicellales bacterium WSBS_2016_MAG_OTU3]
MGDYDGRLYCRHANAEFDKRDTNHTAITGYYAKNYRNRSAPRNTLTDGSFAATARSVTGKNGYARHDD